MHYEPEEVNLWLMPIFNLRHLSKSTLALLCGKDLNPGNISPLLADTMLYQEKSLLVRFYLVFVVGIDPVAGRSPCPMHTQQVIMAYLFHRLPGTEFYQYLNWLLGESDWHLNGQSLLSTCPF